MTVYFVLIAVVLLLPFAFAGVKNPERREKRILAFSMLALFLVMALRAPSVGRDVESYKGIYEMMQYRLWSDFDVSWMEAGYELLMMVFVHVFHMSFQMFLTVIYGFTYYSYYRFLKRYTHDYTTAVLLYICFTFFTFDMSAVRTMLGVAICLFAVPFAEKKIGWNTLAFTAITMLAVQIHKSAYIFFAVYFIIKIPVTTWSSLFYVGIPVALLFFRKRLFVYINYYFKTVRESGSAMGGNLLIYIFSLVLTLAIWYYYTKKTPPQQEEQKGAEASLPTEAEAEALSSDDSVGYFASTGIAMRIIYAGIVMQLFAANSVLARMAQYMQIFIIVLIPNNIERLNTRSRIAVKGLLYFLAVLYFWRFSLFENALDIVPYTFFWNAN